MKRLAFALLVTVVAGGFVIGLHAQTVQWTLEDVVFEDGGTVTGFFEYDAATGNMVDYSVRVEGGNTATFPPFSYTPETSFGRPISGGDDWWLMWSVESSDRSLRLEPAQELGPDGGVVDFMLGIGSFSVECFNCAPFRLVAGGRLVGGPPGWTHHVPAFGAITGSAGSQWNSTLQLINLGDGDNDVTFRYYDAATGMASEATMTLARHQMVTLDDLMTTIGVEGIGSLTILSSREITGVARIYSIDAAGGTVGQSFPLIPDDDLLGAGEAGVAPLAGDTGQFRSNIGWYQIDAGQVEFQFYDAAGDLRGSTDHFFADHAYAQKRASDWMGSPVADGWRIVAKVLSGKGTGFVSDIDNKTNDPTTKLLINTLGSSN